MCPLNVLFTTVGNTTLQKDVSVLRQHRFMVSVSCVILLCDLFRNTDHYLFMSVENSFEPYCPFPVFRSRIAPRNHPSSTYIKEKVYRKWKKNGWVLPRSFFFFCNPAESSNNKMSRGILFAECTIFTLQVWYGPENLASYFLFSVIREMEKLAIEKVAYHSTYGKSI